MGITSHPTYRQLPRVTAVRHIAGFKMHLSFENGTEKDLDLEPYLKGPIFEPVRQDPQLFAAVYVDGDTIAWPNGADIDPDTLYYEGPPPWADHEPQHEPTHARPQ